MKDWVLVWTVVVVLVCAVSLAWMDEKLSRQLKSVRRDLENLELWLAYVLKKARFPGDGENQRKVSEYRLVVAKDPRRYLVNRLLAAHRVMLTTGPGSPMWCEAANLADDFARQIDFLERETDRLLTKEREDQSRAFEKAVRGAGQ